jgi:type II secretory pathway pseudopilin PulG
VTTTAVLRDAGESLVELLVTVVILGIATAGIAGALFATGRASNAHRQMALAQNALRVWAEQLGAGIYNDCAAPDSFADPDPDPALPTDFTAAVATVQYWSGTAFVSTCGTDTGVQKVTLTVTAPNGLARAVVRSMVVILRKQCDSVGLDPIC